MEGKQPTVPVLAHGEEYPPLAATKEAEVMGLKTVHYKVTVNANLEHHMESGGMRILIKNIRQREQGHTHILKDSNRERGLGVGTIVRLPHNKEMGEGAGVITLLLYQHTSTLNSKRMSHLWMTSGRLGDEKVDDHGLVAKRKEGRGMRLLSRTEEERVINAETI